MKGITLARKGLVGVAVGALLLAGSLLVVGQVAAVSVSNITRRITVGIRAL